MVLCILQRGGDYISINQQLELPFQKLNSKDSIEFLPYIPMRLTVNEIVEQYLQKHMDYRTYEKLHKLVECGTGKIVYHVDVCDHCGVVRVVANPCNHSICPVCQERRSKLWIESRLPELLNVPYFHIVFCLPNKLFQLAMYNKKIIFDIMFKAVANAMNEIPDRDKIEIGFIASLHTSAANIWFDPHMHVCTPGIGILNDGKMNEYTSVEALRLTKAQLSKKYCDSFLENLQEIYFEQEVKISEEKEEDIIKWPENLKELEHDEEKFKNWIEELRNEKWDVNVEDATESGSAKSLIEYIGQRLAITDRQLIEADDETIKFKDKRGKKIEMSIEEFIRRLTLHTMPSGYHRIRNYGFLSNCKKTEKLREIREKLGLEEPEQGVRKISICKQCKEGEMRTVATLLGGETVKTFEKNIKKLKILPTWLRPLQEVESLPTAPPEVVSKLPDWLIRLIQSVDDD